MALSMDSDEEDTFVVIGKQVEQLEDDEARKKRVSVNDLPVTDEKGRQRFHGAFTGGFSAGYFNSVGTKEGWAPSTFVSSRKSKTDHVSQSVEDFMDDEDFSEHGIAPRKIATSDSFSSIERQQKRKTLASAMTGDSIQEGDTTLMDLIIPETLPIGIKLLRKMGWKEGQGVGPRMSRKMKKKKKALERQYGSSMKPDSTSEESNSDDEEYLKNVTFAPKDTNPVSFVAKDNVHGIGYRGLNPSSALPSGHINFFEPPSIKSKPGKRGIRGKGFGVGALEDEDEDIYGVDHLSNYDMTMDIEDENQYGGWTAPKGPKAGQGKVHVGYVGKLLEGFTLSSKTLKPNKIYPPPTLPRHFKPVHRIKGPVVAESIANVGVDLGRKDNRKKTLTATDRALQLGETPVIGSVFDLISKEDKNKMDEAKSGKLNTSQTAPIDITPNPILLIPNVEDIPLPPSPDKPTPPKSSSFTTTPPTKTLSRWDMKERKTLSLTSPEIAVPENVFKSPSETLPSSNTPLFTGSLSFKPFAKCPEKQHRYENYLALVRQGKKDPYLGVVGGSMTEWEREREREEFVKASKLYKPLSGMMASRFTSAKYGDDTETVDVPIDDGVDKSDKAKAAEMKMFGQLTRETFEWHPEKVLCKRFNVPDPYPGSSISGLPTVKRDKYSVYNFLSFPVSDFTPEQPPTNTTSVTEPLAIEDKPVESSEKSAASKVSFNMKKKPSIFNVLFEDAKPKTSHYKGGAKETMSDKGDNKEEKLKDIKIDTEEEMEISSDKTEVPEKNEEKPFDLFRAVFKNSDSEISSSSSSDEDEQEEKPPEKISTESPTPSPTRLNTSSYRLPGDGTLIQSVEERLSPFVATENKHSIQQDDNRTSKWLPSENLQDNESLVKNSEPHRSESQETNKFKFSKPSTSKSNHDISSTKSGHQSGSGSRQRSRSGSRNRSRSLSRSSDSEEKVEYYGPVPPQPGPLGSKDELKKSLKEHRESFKPKHKKKSHRKDKYAKSEKHKKRSKDKYKDKHKHRSKEKKSKHKKHKEKKSKKKKQKEIVKSDVSDESSDDSDVIVDDKKLDEQILSRLRDLPHQKKR